VCSASGDRVIGREKEEPDVMCSVNDCFLSVAFFEGFEAYRIQKEHGHDFLSRSYFIVKQKVFLSRVSETILGKCMVSL
jgi:hypothetical protein